MENQSDNPHDHLSRDEISFQQHLRQICTCYSQGIQHAKAHTSKLNSLIHGRCKFSAADIIEAAKHSVGISDDCYAFEIIDAIENLELIQRRIEIYDAQIKKLVDELCPNLLTVPDIGYVTAGLIAGEIGDAERFHSAESLVSFSGVDVTVYESGKYKAKYLLPSKKVSRYLR